MRREGVVTGALTSCAGGATKEVVAFACIASMTSSIPTSLFADPARLLKACTQHKMHAVLVAGMYSTLHVACTVNSQQLLLAYVDVDTAPA